MSDEALAGPVLDDSGEELRRVVAGIVTRTPGVVRLVRPRWRRGTGGDEAAVRVSSRDGATGIEVEICVDLTVPIVVLTDDLRTRIRAAVEATGRAAGPVTVVVSRAL